VRPNVTKNASALVVTKNEKGDQFVIAVFSSSWNENATRVKELLCTVSSIRLLFRFD